MLSQHDTNRALGLVREKNIRGPSLVFWPTIFALICTTGDFVPAIDASKTFNDQSALLARVGEFLGYLH